MKKRQFLAPLAVAVATLLSASVASAAVQDKTVTHETVKIVSEAGISPDTLVIERSNQTTIETAYHRSHYSHRSHSSHSSHQSHYSSRW